MQASPNEEHGNQSIHPMPPAAQHDSKVVSQPIKGLAVTQTARCLYQHLRQQLRHLLQGQEAMHTQLHRPIPCQGIPPYPSCASHALLTSIETTCNINQQVCNRQQVRLPHCAVDAYAVIAYAAFHQAGQSSGASACVEPRAGVEQTLS